MNRNNDETKGSSKYRGVCWVGQRRKWKAYIKHKQVMKNIGMYDQEDDAARAYNEKAIDLFGEFANLNDISDK